ncbi:MAG: histidinol dehydrogenase [Rhodospirillaceae bacterium]|nr:histidinol dehydrogenase [Rhodospirillaceae bacterium]
MTEKKAALHRLEDYSLDQMSALLSRTGDDLSPYMAQVAPVIEQVREGGDAALAALAEKFDNADMSGKQLLATKVEINAAFDQLEPDLIDALGYAADNIRRFHEHQKPERDWSVEIRPGIDVGERAFPIKKVALYSPRGKGSFPSVTLMTAIPAVVAGVPEPVILTPPGEDGNIDPATLVAARLAGVEMVAKAGGAQAVAAAAYGTQSIPKCQKIEGPGSPWFVAAKRLLADKIDSRLPAGPSEVIVLADETANPELAALDILIETEHGPDSSGFLVTWSEHLAAKVLASLPTYLARMSPLRQQYALTVLSGTNGGVILTQTAEQAYQFINDYAPEHCQILSKQPDQHLPHITTASEILLGEYAAGSLANYMMGPNCVLPTSGAARTHSPLGVRDFMRTASVGRVSAEGFAEMAPKTEIFARYEGFDAHANAVSLLRGKLMEDET